MSKYGSLALVISILMVLIADTLSAPPLLAAANVCPPYQFEPSPNYTQSDSRALLKICDGARHQVVWKTPQGTTAACHPYGGGGCTTINEYDALGKLISTTWEFYIAGQQRPSGPYMAIVTTCNNYIGTTCIGWAESFRANFYINDISAAYTVFLPLM